MTSTETPAVGQRRAETQTPIDEPAVLEERKWRILLVEDDPVDRIVVSRALARAPFEAELTVAMDFQAAVAALKIHNFDCALIDLNFPGGNGMSLLGFMEEELESHLPVIMLTGNDDHHTAIDALHHGAEDYLVKGTFDTASFARAIRYAIERHTLHTALALANKRLQTLATVDPLTELLNRRGLQEVLNRELRRCDRKGSSLVVLLADVDNFRHFNDVYGHNVGDDVLRALAAGLNRAVRGTDYVARIGGDEFLCLLPDTHIPGARLVAERVRQGVADATLTLENGDVLSVTSSIGVCLVDSTDTNIDDLLARTHDALYESKRAGKNCVSVATASPTESEGPKLEETIEMLSSVASYRHSSTPIVSFDTDEVWGWELLARSSLEGFRTPSDLRRACDDPAALIATDLAHLTSALRAGAETLVNERPNLLKLITILPTSLLNLPVSAFTDVLGDEAERVCLMVSEHLIVGIASPLVTALEALRAANIKVGLDDVTFSRGSLENLILLKPDFVRIQPKQTSDLADQHGQRRTLMRLLACLETSGVEAIATGVQSVSDLSVLKELGVKHGQGFLWR